METLVGFAVGFWLGTKEGREGLVRLIESVEAIRAKVDVKALVGDAIAAFTPVLKDVAQLAGGKAA